MPRVLVVVLALLAIAVVVAWCLLNKHSPPPSVILPEVPAGVPALPADLAGATGPIIAWSAQTQARFEPCGCTAGMYGGLVRRAGLLARVPAERLLSLELGGWSAGKEPHQVLKSGFYLRGLRAAGIDAVAVGTAEVALGAPLLAGLAKDATTHGLSLLAANVQGVAGITPSLRMTVAGKELVLTAVVSRSALGDGMTVSDPADSLVPVLAAAGNAEVVVLADLSETALLDLARAHPRLSLIVGGAVEGPTPQPLTIGAVRVVHVANHGKTIGWWAWGAQSCHFDLIPDSLPDVPVLRTLVGDYQRTLAATDLPIDHGAGRSAYVGDATCASCHASAHALQSASRHAQSFASLEKKGYHADPECLRCHVTAFAQDGGYRRPDAVKRDSRMSVSCEACHGPGQAHVMAGGKASPLRPVGAATCVACHDAENSPKFSFEIYWKKVTHGK
ncbi:MAG: hypothetical protein H0W78_00150 [Planctomycetes bacterium]|nr:hypothetical protein [Planctomycetota bacterium]